MDQTLDHFCTLLAEQGLTLTARQQEQFELYYQELINWNDKINLTAITARDQVYVKHFYDSLSLSFYVGMDAVKSMADIGSGAGFPGLPLKILFPELRLLLVDSLHKRIRFLQHLVDRLELTDVLCVHARAEEAARDERFRDRFDLVTARAVARLNVLCELCLPFVAPAGRFVAMKGIDPRQELNEAGNCLEVLKATVDQVVRFELPVEGAARHLIIFNKTGVTPRRYPRKPGVPMKQPLI